MAEMVITLVILGVLASFAVPGFSGLIATSKFNRVTDSLRSTIDFTRYSALTASINVAICPSANPNATNPACSASTEKNYEDGWIVYRECNANGVVDTGSNVCDGATTPEYVLKTQPPLADILIESSNTTRLMFDDSGRTNSAVSFDIENDILAYTVSVNSLGRIVVAATP